MLSQCREVGTAVKHDAFMAHITEKLESARIERPVHPQIHTPKYPGVPVTCNGNQLVAQHVEARVTEGGVFYPITPSTEGGELYQQAYAEGKLDVWGRNKIAIETEGEHAAQGGGFFWPRKRPD